MSDTYQPETGPGAADPPSSAASELKRTAAEAKEATVAEVREGIARGTAKVQEAAEARGESAKPGLAQEVSATAEALGAAAREMEGHSLQRRLLQEAADGLTSISQALEGRERRGHRLRSRGVRSPQPGGIPGRGDARGLRARQAGAGLGARGPRRHATTRPAGGADASAGSRTRAARARAGPTGAGQFPSAAAAVGADPLERGAF